MPITSNNPIVVPAQPQITYDRWWINDFHSVAPDPSQPIHVHAEMTAMGVANGQPVLSGDHSVSFDVADALNLPAEDDAAIGAVLTPQTLAAILAAAPSKSAALVELIAQCLGALAKRRGVIS